MLFNKKTFTAIMSVLLIIIAAVGCSFKSSDDDLGAKLTVDGEDTDVPYVMKIDGEEISLDEYGYYFFSSKYYYDYGDESVWEGEDSEQQEELLKAEVVDSIKQSHLIVKKAIDYGYELTDADIQFIDDSITSQISDLGGQREYRKTLSEKHLTEKVFHDQWELSLYYDYLYSYYFDEGGVYYDSSATDVDSDTVKEANYKKLNDLLSVEAESMTVEFGPQYELITVKTLS